MSGERKSIEATVWLMYERDPAKQEKSCVCCPDFPAHVFSDGIELDPFESALPEHFGRGVNEWLRSVFDYKALEGRRLRITAELLPAVPPDAPELRARATAAFVEAGAAIEHTRWAHWQSYLHSKCTENPDGSLTIPAGYVQALRKQIETPYAKLSEPEKESDRKEVRSYLPLLDSFAAALGEAGLLARSEGEAVGLLRRLVAAAGIMDSAESRLEAMVTVAWDARAFLSRSGSRPGPDAPSYGALAEALRPFAEYGAMRRALLGKEGYRELLHVFDDEAGSVVVTTEDFERAAALAARLPRDGETT